jgi:hypothetical protein
MEPERADFPYEAESKQKVTEAISVIMNELNGGPKKKIAMAIYDRVSREHRTLQQAFWSAMLLAQIEYATDPFDLRNEAAVKLANRVKEMAKAKQLRYGLGLHLTRDSTRGILKYETHLQRLRSGVCTLPRETRLHQSMRKLWCQDCRKATTAPQSQSVMGGQAHAHH